MSETNGNGAAVQAVRPCPICGGPIPPSKSAACKQRKQCSAACTNTAARRRWVAAKRTGVAPIPPARPAAAPSTPSTLAELGRLIIARALADERAR